MVCFQPKTCTTLCGLLWFQFKTTNIFEYILVFSLGCIESLIEILQSNFQGVWKFDWKFACKLSHPLESLIANFQANFHTAFRIIVVFLRKLFDFSTPNHLQPKHGSSFFSLEEHLKVRSRCHLGHTPSLEIWETLLPHVQNNEQKVILIEQHDIPKWKEVILIDEVCSHTWTHK